MSQSAAQRVRTKRETHYTSAKGGTRPDLGMYFRSNWEANFARIQNLLGVQWQYEVESFQLTDTLSYTPDFKVGDEYYELKGRMDQGDLDKIAKFREQHSELILHVIGPEEYNKLRAEFKSKIPNWEGR
jgi:hypothetical protein